MKLSKVISIFVIITFIIFFNLGVAFSSDWSKSHEITVDIPDHATLEIGEDILIRSEKPWPGEEVREEKTGLILKNNIDVVLSWVSTEIINKDTGRALPLGTWEEQNNNRSMKKESKPKSFGLTASLIPAGNNLSSLEQEEIMNSKVTKDNRLESLDHYRFKPGRHELDIIISYFWSAESNWFEIHAGSYSGEILYTISAVND